MRVECEKVTGRDLKPGDLFSTAGNEYWSEIGKERYWLGIKIQNSIGERCYIRSDADVSNAPDADSIVYRLTIVRD